ncbi:MAG: hypothetical protein Q7T56_07275 [Nocardioidaceae bacterium]|nr:hypothetical protein [Nocardioidaceae bacterium]
MPRIPPAFTFDFLLAIVCSERGRHHERRGATTIAEFGALDAVGGKWVELQHRREASSVSLDEAHQSDRTLRPTSLVVIDDRGELDVSEVKDWIELSVREGSTVEGADGGPDAIDVEFLGARAHRDLHCGCGLHLTMQHDKLCLLLDGFRAAGHSTVELGLIVRAATTPRRGIFDG